MLGREFILIPCLNDRPLWLAALKNMIWSFFQRGGVQSVKTDAQIHLRIRMPVILAAAEFKSCNEKDTRRRGLIRFNVLQWMFFCLPVFGDFSIPAGPVQG